MIPTDSLCTVCGRETSRRHIGCTRCPQCGGLKSATALRCYACAWPDRQPRRARQLDDQDRPVAENAPVDHRRRAISFRVACFSCGRSRDVDAVPSSPGRCPTCGGSMLVETRE